MKALYASCFLLLASFSALPSICQQSTACQTTLETSGQQLQSDIASIRSAAQSAGQSQAQIQSLIKGYLESAVSSLPATCSQAATKTAATNNKTQKKPATNPPTQSAANTVSQPANPTPAPVVSTNKPPAPTPPVTTDSESTQANTTTPPTNILTCQNKAMDGTQPIPTLDPIDVSGDPKTVIAVTGTVPNGSTGTVQLCTENDSPTGVPSYTSITPSGKVPIDSKTGKFTITPPASLTAGQKIVAQWISPGDATVANTYSLITPAAIAGQCDADKIDSSIAAPTLTTTQVSSSGSTSINVNVSTASAELLRVCVDGLQVGSPVAVKSTTSTTGSSTTITPTPVTIPAPAKSGQTIVTQVVTGSQMGSGSHFGRFSTELAVDSCTAVGSGNNADRPTANKPVVGSQTVSGNIPLINGTPAANFVRVCLAAPRIAGKDVYENQIAVATVDRNGDFRAALPGPIVSGQSVLVQGITSNVDAAPSTYGLPGYSKPAGFPYSSLFGSFIGGAEQSGYSSDNINTNAFISAYIRSAYWWGGHERALALSGRVRLLSAPQQSAPNIVATLSNPSNTISQTSLTSVGAVIDYSIGPEIRLWQWNASGGQVSRFSLIGGIGETTPLTTPSPAILNVPAYNTTDCTNLISRYIGSTTPLTSGANLPTPACLENPIPASAPTAYKYIAYTQQRRTNFLFKWGGGIRFTHIYPAKATGGSPYSGMLDLTLGQDQTITGGALSGVVFKMDAQYPLPFSSLSAIYFFGSTSVRIARNQNDPTITMTSTTGAPAIPDPSILVLSTEQPNRDFYRFGIGLNLTDVFSSVFNKGTSSAEQDSSPTTPSSAK